MIDGRARQVSDIAATVLGLATGPETDGLGRERLAAYLAGRIDDDLDGCGRVDGGAHGFLAGGRGRRSVKGIGAPPALASEGFDEGQHSWIK